MQFVNKDKSDIAGSVITVGTAVLGTELIASAIPGDFSQPTKLLMGVAIAGGILAFYKSKNTPVDAESMMYSYSNRHLGTSYDDANYHPNAVVSTTVTAPRTMNSSVNRNGPELQPQFWPEMTPGRTSLNFPTLEGQLFEGNPYQFTAK